MEKINQVMDMVEHPERYTEAQVEEILQDEGGKQTYLTMMEMRMAFDKKAIENSLDVDQEWDAFMKRQPQKDSQWAWPKIAASLVGVLLLSGIAVAAIHTFSSSRHDEKQEIADTTVVMTAPQTEVAQSNKIKKEEALKPKAFVRKTFDNVTLGSMLDEMAKYYGVSIEYRNAEAKQLRFYYEWNSENELNKVLDELNHSQRMNLSFEGDKIIVE